LLHLETGETGETYDAQMFSQHFEAGDRVAVVKEGDLYFGESGQVVSIAASDGTAENVCKVDFGDSGVAGYSVSDLIRMPSSGMGITEELLAAWSTPRKDPLRCEEWNNACLYDGYRFCPNDCGLWLCTHHYQKHEVSCPNSSRLDGLIVGTRVGL
jgi:hypothetical protein